jgi:nucleoside-diphosphate-sugar epimerase
MRVFVAGATGVIGRRLVPMLVAAGHQVTGMTRSEGRAAGLRAAGADAAVCDAFDRPAVVAAVAAARPDVVIHQLTQIPRTVDLRRYARQFAPNSRLRRDGTRNLLEAASQAGVGRMIAQGIAFAYRPEGTWVKDEDEPLYLDAPEPFGETVRAVADLERQVLGHDRVRGVVLRYGAFYGPETALAADGQIGEMVRARRFPIVGGGSAVYSFVHVDDAASATVAALDLGEGSSRVFNVVDDEPAAVREWLPIFAGALEAPRPLRVPAVVGRIAGGRYGLYLMTEQRGASNARIKRELAWSPARPTWRTGFPAALGEARTA